MKIRHSNFHIWNKDALADPLNHFGKNNKARIRSTLNRVGDYNITYKIEPIGENFMDWFKPFYEKGIGAKKNAKIYNIAKTLTKSDKNRSYHSFSLYENDEPIGGMILSCTNEKLTIAYKLYENTWRTAKLPASPSFYTEYVVSKYAYDQKKSIVSHGKDRNPYGLNSNIGLGIFKLSAGYSPLLPLNYEVIETETNSLETDVLIMNLPKEEKKIKKATLIITKKNEEKYRALHSYSDILEIDTIYRT